MSKSDTSHRVHLTMLLNKQPAQGRFRIAPATDWIWCEGVIDVKAREGDVIEIDVRGDSRKYTVQAAPTDQDATESAELDFGATTDISGDLGGFFKTYSLSPLVERNIFRGRAYDHAPIPTFDDLAAAAPVLAWEGHDDAVACYNEAWRFLSRKFHEPLPGSGFSRNFVYTEFANAVFIWGCSFITMFGRYAARAFPFIETLDNFYGAQDDDGFIPRQLCLASGRSAFERGDLSSVGGNIFAWAELRSYECTRDLGRLRNVHPVLLAYHKWLKAHRTWTDGTYFGSGWGCGMDNIPRIDATKYNVCFDHGFISFLDITLQQIFNAKNLIKIARLIGTDEGVEELREEVESLTKIANERMWDDKLGVYCDLDRDGNRVQAPHVGTFWAMLAGITTEGRLERLIKNLEDPGVFAVACGTASTARTAPGFVADGGDYWRGGVWCMMEFMISQGLHACGKHDVAARIARRHVDAVVQVFNETGTIWESYDPSRVAPGKNCGSLVRRDFVGFSGTAPIALLIEDVLGVRVEDGEVVWRPNLVPEKHAIKNLHLYGSDITLSNASGEPVATSDPPIPIRIK